MPSAESQAWHSPALRFSILVGSVINCGRFVKYNIAFLMRAYSDLDGALEAFRKALVFQPSTLVRREEARVLLYMGMYDQAKEILDELLETKSLSKRLVASLEDLKIQYYCRNFEYQMETGDERKALNLLIAARQHGVSIPADVFDERMGQKYPRIVPKVESLFLRLEGTDEGALMLL